MVPPNLTPTVSTTVCHFMSMQTVQKWEKAVFKFIPQFVLRRIDLKKKHLQPTLLPLFEQQSMKLNWAVECGCILSKNLGSDNFLNSYITGMPFLHRIISCTLKSQPNKTEDLLMNNLEGKTFFMHHWPMVQQGHFYINCSNCANFIWILGHAELLFGLCWAELWALRRMLDVGIGGDSTRNKEAGHVDWFVLPLIMPQQTRKHFCRASHESPSVGTTCT